MGVFSRIANAFRAKPSTQLARVPRGVKLSQIRSFAAAKATRLTALWSPGHQSMNADIFFSLRELRARSRDLWANNVYGKRWLSQLRSDVVGPHGFRLQMRVVDDESAESPRPDVRANRIIEQDWARFSQVGNFDVTGKLSRVAAENLFITTVARDGECLVRLRRGFNNAQGYAVQFVDIDRLDINKNNTGEDGSNRIVMGVEIDADDRPVAYYLLSRHPNGMLGATDSAGVRHERVPAEDILHCFICERAEQVRGIPWAHAAILDIKDVGGYREAAIVAARDGASKHAWWRTPDGEAPYDTVDEDGQRYTTAESGVWGTIGPEDELVQWDPNYPHEQFGEFNKAMLRGIAGALEGSTYHGLSGDLEGVNFTSGRLGENAAHDIIKGLQGWMVGVFHNFIFADWLRWRVTSGGIDLPSSKLDKFNRPKWQPRRWAHVQPREEATANALLWSLRVKSLEQIAAEQGTDLEETFAQIQREMERLQLAGIEPTILGNIQADPGQAENDAGSNVQ